MRDNAQAVIVAADSFFVSQGLQVAALGLKHRVVVISPFGDHAQAGMLASYRPAIADIYRRGASYVDKILKGAKPTDLPIEQPTTIELVINLRTAKTLGIAVPQNVRLLATSVIE
jgi:putative ABC transport system substrate-binding protein